MKNQAPSYQRHRFLSQIISHAVWLYYKNLKLFEKTLLGGNPDKTTNGLEEEGRRENFLLNGDAGAEAGQVYELPRVRQLLDELDYSTFGPVRTNEIFSNVLSSPSCADGAPPPVAGNPIASEWGMGVLESRVTRFNQTSGLHVWWVLCGS